MVKCWPILSEETAYDAGIFRVRLRHSLSPKDGEDKTVFSLDSLSWAVVLAITPSREALLVRQYRHGSREMSLELPGGIIEAGQTPLEAAQRELREETGYRAASWRLLKSLKPNPAIINNTVHGFLAEGAEVAGATQFDENEDIELVSVPLDDLREMIFDGRIDHAIMVAMIGLYFLTACPANE